jgi:hypothetical protein
MRIVKPPQIHFDCENCGTGNEGTPDEFEPQNTMPPSWYATCAFCFAKTRCFPKALVAREIGIQASTASLLELGTPRRTIIPPPQLPRLVRK